MTDIVRQEQTWWASCYKRMDLLLILQIALLSLIGLLVLYSASGSSLVVLGRQLMRLGVSALLMLLLAQIPSRRFEHISPYLFGTCLIMLIAVLMIGHIGKGAQRWLVFAGIRFQPSEMMKIAMPMMLAYLFCQLSLPIRGKGLLITTALLLVPVLLIAKQPDLGTALMIAFSGGCMIFFAGIRYVVILTAAMVFSAACPLLWHHLHDYQKLRVINFLHPEHDPLGSGYHIMQSEIALGSGGLWGKGYLKGSQAYLQFLPEHSTDFIFAVLGEEFGFIGGVTLIVIFLFMIKRCLTMAFHCPHRYGRMVVVGLAINIFLSLFINIGMVTGILPVVGIPLPLASYGGSSMLVVFASFGVMMSINAERHYRT